MELGLSLGEAQKPFPLMDKAIKSSQGLGLCMDLGFGFNSTTVEAEKEADFGKEKEEREEEEEEEEEEKRTPPDGPVQLDLLPLLPVNPHHPFFPWPAEHGNQEAGPSGRCFDANRMPLTVRFDDGAVDSTFRMELSICGSGIKRETEAAGIGLELERSSSRASDEEENSLARKKLRLSKEQSAFLEECFKEHSTLNPKQKLALAKQLNLRPRQVEVWFQNRRARTKLKQTEVDCEYLKRCCETLTIENKRLRKELQELRALKASHSFYTRLPPTTLTMCPSCERVATPSSVVGTDGSGTAAKHRSYSLSRVHRQSAASS